MDDNSDQDKRVRSLQWSLVHGISILLAIIAMMVFYHNYYQEYFKDCMKALASNDSYLVYKQFYETPYSAFTGQRSPIMDEPGRWPEFIHNSLSGFRGMGFFYLTVFVGLAFFFVSAALGAGAIFASRRKEVN